MSQGNSALATLAQLGGEVDIMFGPPLPQPPTTTLHRHLGQLRSKALDAVPIKHVVQLITINVGVVTVLDQLQTIFEQAAF